MILLYEFDIFGVYLHDGLCHTTSREYVEKIVLNDNDGIMSEYQVVKIAEKLNNRWFSCEYFEVEDINIATKDAEIDNDVKYDWI